MIVQACLALSYYQVLPLEMIQRVFNIDFITRIEKELSLTSHTQRNPRSILNLVMQLNRSICLNYPEARVPWFQQNFIEAQLVASPPKSNPYTNEIYKMLLSYVGGDKSMIRLNHKTPYGYRIPFVVYFNSQRQLVSPPFDEGPQTLNKVAIIPLPKTPVQFNGRSNKRGIDILQERHLSILGYIVIQICYREWNSIYMDLPGAREEYLQNIFNKYKFLVS
ncbi:FAST kinase domain-containing protein 1, mitochondrial-like [Contarinia nasturtii]|uniref:FAST kinase domain-containing protein 1, mitochondrial-like n=1 Tax=Contarinia nasturtii TaxID=265458 RepID=UPI0012D40B4D|nr:FAST kinase domain-containing protein 1, mitochondrial-like [Contarinia nasturtii]